MKVTTLLFIILVPFLIYSQEKNNNSAKYSGYAIKNSNDIIKGNISGRIVDSTTKKPLEYASISLINIINNKIIEGTISNSKGRFTMNNINTGEYIILISYLGYQELEIKIELTKKKPDFKLTLISLTSNSEMLSEVKISEDKPIFESKIDKIVYNAENDMNEGLNDATDVLRKAPLLIVDLEGNVSLRGSNNIKFLVNGKASTFFSSDVSTALGMIPAEEIKSIEVITSPGAKYDGEGDAGIVNIITKRKMIDGYKSTVNGSFGTRVNKQSANLSLGKGRFGISARGSARYSWPREGEATFTRENWDRIDNNGQKIGLKTLNEISNTFSQWIGYGGSKNMYYDINAYNGLLSDIRFGGRNTFSNDSTILNNIEDTSRYSYNSYLESSDINTYIEWSTDFTKKFASNDKKELNISFQIGGDLGDEDIRSSINEENQYNTDYDEKEVEFTIQSDYTHPFMQENKLEIGGKLINRFREIQSTTISNFEDYRSPKDIFNYKQQVAASYISSQWKITNNIDLKTGIRYEHTIISGNWTSKAKEDIGNNYGNILPSLTISKKYSKRETVKLTYNNRILRPGIRNINPYILRNNNFSITEGNPKLTPANAQQLEFGYNKFGRKYQGSYYIYTKQTTDIIESYARIKDSITTNIFENIGSSTNYGFNYFGSLRLNKFNIRAGFNLYQYIGKGVIDDEEIELTSPLLYSYNFGGTYNIGNQWKAECRGFYRSDRQTIQGSSTSFSMMSFGIKKDFKNKRGSLGIKIIEPFNKNKVFKTDIKGEDFTQISERSITFRSIGISFKYTFGKLNFKSSNKQSNIKNNDVSEEQNSNF